MRFTDPYWALLFLPLAAGLVFSWRHMHGIAKARKRFAFFTRFALASCLIIALMGPQSHRPNKGTAIVFLMDRSDSVSEEDRRKEEEFVDSVLKSLGPEDSGSVVSFGKEPVFESAAGGKRSLGRMMSKVDPSASDLAAAIRLASASFPEGKARRIVVLSDGNETTGDAARAAEAAALDGVTLDYVPLGGQERRTETSILELQVPSDRRSGQPFQLRTLIESSAEQTATLVIERNGTAVEKRSVNLSRGKNWVTLDQKIEDTGFYRFRAAIEAAEDSDSRNNVGAAFVNVRGKPRVLVLQGDTARTDLTDALSKQGVTADLAGPGGIPVRPEEIQPYDAVILNDINAQFFSPQQMELLRAATNDTGIGLAMIGGEDSFLPGGWYGTPVAEALPVDLDVRQRKSFPSTTVLIVVDTSGSMGMVEDGIEKYKLAIKAAEKTAELLSPNDRIGVAGSTDDIEYVAPIQKLTNKQAVISNIRKLRPGGGGVYAEPSMTFASKELSSENTKVRHLIFLADGADTDSYGRSLAIAAHMRQEKITTTVVAIGGGKDEKFLQDLARVGGGQYHLADKASKLPQIFTQDVSVMSRSAIEEGAFLPIPIFGEETLKGIDPASIPPLYAYCLADIKPLAKLGMKSHKSDPILATWQYGLGTSLAFTSDAKAQWAAPWVPWEGFAQFWAQAVRIVSRRSSENDYQMEVKPVGGYGELTLYANDRLGNPLSSNDKKVRVSAPQGGSHDIVLLQEAPGVFKGRFPADELGSYIVSVVEPGLDGQNRVSSSGFSVPYPPEYQFHATNLPTLEGMAQVTQGIALKEPIDALRPVARPGVSIKDLWLKFILWAALLLPLDIGLRRIAIPMAQILAKVKARLARGATAQEPVATTITRLRMAKEATEQKPTQDKPQRIIVERQEEETKPMALGGSAATRLLESKKRRRDGQ